MRLTRPSLILFGAAALLLTSLLITQLVHQKPSLNSLPGDQNPLLIRTDFSDDAAWQTIRAAVMKIPPDLRENIEIMKAVNAAGGADVSEYDQSGEFVHIMADPQYADCTTQQVLDQVAKNSQNACLFIVDRRTITDPDHPILVIDLSRPRGRTFRTIPSEVWAIAANLEITNLDWEDFADNVDSDGIYHGFPQPAP
jgi:hypothetical protein